MNCFCRGHKFSHLMYSSDNYCLRCMENIYYFEETDKYFCLPPLLINYFETARETLEGNEANYYWRKPYHKKQIFFPFSDPFIQRLLEALPEICTVIEECQFEESHNFCWRALVLGAVAHTCEVWFYCECVCKSFWYSKLCW